MLLAQFEINSTRDAWRNFAKLDPSHAALVQFWQIFQTSLVLLTPNFMHARIFHAY